MKTLVAGEVESKGEDVEDGNLPSLLFDAL
jgi:hypothetical protein